MFMLIGLGSALVVGSILHKPDAIGWLIGWVLVGAGGWFIPRRFVSGMFVGAAIAMESLILLIFLEKRINPPSPRIHVITGCCATSDTVSPAMKLRETIT